MTAMPITYTQRDDMTNGNKRLFSNTADGSVAPCRTKKQLHAIKQVASSKVSLEDSNISPFKRDSTIIHCECTRTKPLQEYKERTPNKTSKIEHRQERTACKTKYSENTSHGEQ